MRTKLQKMQEYFEVAHPTAVLIGLTSGLPTWRRGSNINHVVNQGIDRGYDSAHWDYHRVQGAHRQNATQGWLWAIYATPKPNYSGIL